MSDRESRSLAASDRLGQRVFFSAGIYGLVVLLPQYFLESQFEKDFPPPLTHPEYFYGFVGVALAWQVAFLLMSRDIGRYRPLIIPGILEKLLFAGSTFTLYAQGRVHPLMAAAAGIDLLLAGLFAWVYVRHSQSK